MSILLDTSVLVRLANQADPAHLIADRAVVELHRRKELLHVTSQNLVEFRNVATRPAAQNGLGLAAYVAEAKAANFETLFPLLPETPDVFPAWKRLVVAAGVLGKRVHDARLVSVCHVHKVTQLLTFNSADFLSLSGFSPGVIVIHPASV